MRTDGTPLAPSNTRTVALGDAERDPNTQAPTAPPSLRKDGETLPANTNPASSGSMRPVQFPKQKPTDQTDSSAETPPPAPEVAKPQPESPEDAHPAPAPAATPPVPNNPPDGIVDRP
jgi:hypothetical protein